MTQADLINLPNGQNLTSIAPQLHGQATAAFGFMDSLCAVVLALLIIGSLALAFYSRGHPYLAAIAIFIQVFYLIGGLFVKIFWEAISTSTPDLQAIAISHFQTTSLILTAMPLISFLTLIAIIVLYFTRSNDEIAYGA